jgi:plasmid stability protein
MCQMCDEYEAELRRMGIAMDDRIIVDLDQEAMSELERQAKEHGQTASDEARHIIREHLNRERLRRDPIAWSRHIRSMTNTNVPQTDSLILLRQDRDR